MHASTGGGRSHEEENKYWFKSLNLITSTLQETLNLTAYTFKLQKSTIFDRK